MWTDADTGKEDLPVERRTATSASDGGAVVSIFGAVSAVPVGADLRITIPLELTVMVDHLIPDAS